MDFGHQLWRHKHKECSRHGTSLRPPICIGKGCSSLGSDWRLLHSWIATTERDKMAGSHVYSHSPAIFLYFLLFSTCCEFMVLHTYLSEQAFLRYVVCDPTSSEAAESPPSKGSYLIDNYYLCWRFRRRCFFSFNSQIFSSVKMS